MSKIKSISAPIFKDHPTVDKVYVVGEYGFITENSAKLYAQGKKEIHTVARDAAATAEDPTPPTLTGNFKGLNKLQLLAQGKLRGMTLSKDDKNADLVAQLKAFDAKISRGDEDPEANGEPGTPDGSGEPGTPDGSGEPGTPAEEIEVTEPENVD